MNRKNVSIFLSFTFLIFIICSGILPVFSLQNNVSISSYGTVNYSGLPPSTSSGEIFLWVQFTMTDGNGNPNAAAQRIANARIAYGNPTWVEAGNWEWGHLTSKLINYFHSVGIKVSCRLWSRYGDVNIEQLKHSMDPSNPYGGSVDYQLSIGPEIDMIMIDECADWNPSYYQELANYVHSKGKLFAVNPGHGSINDAIVTVADKVSIEFFWREFIRDKGYLIAQYPTKFIGVSNDWGYANLNVIGKGTTVNLARAVLDTKEAWNGGVYYFESRSTTGLGYGEEPPDWWEQYLSQLPK